MPTYLLHGFRWPRPLVRIHIIMQNLDDAAPEWLVAPKTTLTLLRNFHQLYPECMEHLGSLRFVEQYDPNDTTATGVSQPFAYVADMVEEVTLGVEIDDVRGRGLKNEQWSSIMELRDKIAPEEKVGWYIVVCGDEERQAPPEEDVSRASASSSSLGAHRQSDTPSQSAGHLAGAATGGKASASQEQLEPKEKGMKKFFSLRLGRKKSRTPVNDSNHSQSKGSQSRPREATASSSEQVPPLPTGLLPSGDGSSSTPSIPPSATASTPPLPEDIAELPAITPTSSASTPPLPPDDNFIPEIETKAKYTRMSEIPDYRQSWFPEVEPKYANMPPISAMSKNSNRRHSEIPAAAHRQGGPEQKWSPRRNSEIPSLPERSPRRSSVSAAPHRSESPEYRMGGRVMSFPNVRSGAVSPLTFRSISPVGWRNGAVSPVARNHSPIRSGAVSPLGPEETSFAKVQRRTTWQLKQQRQKQGLQLNTQVEEKRPASAGSDENEVMDEIIMMSPAVRAPPKHVFRRSGTAASLGLSASKTNLPAGLDSIVEGEQKPYFGQAINADDLVAVNLENAFDRF